MELRSRVTEQLLEVITAGTNSKRESNDGRIDPDTPIVIQVFDGE
jgi:hypothetical protein